VAYECQYTVAAILSYPATLTQPKENETGVKCGTGPALNCAIAIRRMSPPIRSSMLKMSPGFCSCPRSQDDVPSSEAKAAIFAKKGDGIV